MSKKKVGVCLTPELIHQFEVDQSIVVVIDVLRATSSMCVAFDHGAAKMKPMIGVEECRAMREKGYLIAAERGGEKIEGFDFGNSPFSYMTKEVKGKNIAITTTNGTVAIQAALEHKAKEIVVGSFANISILADYLTKKNENVLLLCSGWRGFPNLEDTIFAGAMVKKLRSNFELYEDTALISETLFKMANRRKGYYLRNSSHFARCMHLQIQKDVKYCLKRDTHPVIPVLKGDHLENIYKR